MANLDPFGPLAGVPLATYSVEMNFPLRSVIGCAVLAVALSSCATPDENTNTNTKSDVTDSAQPNTQKSGTGPALVPDSTSTGFADGGTAPKVDANNASEAEIVAALKKLDVKEPEKWAGVVMKNRPYQADDQYFSKLRKPLKEQGLDDEAQDPIVSVLEVKK